MSKSIEIEFKNVLTEEEFTLLTNELNITKEMFQKQDNHYFETDDFRLKEKSCALRIREKANKFELTLKEPLTKGLLETNQNLNQDEATLILQGEGFISGPVFDRLQELAISVEDLKYVGTLTTKRAEQEYEDGLIVLDYSTYLNHSDFEVEYEVSNYEKGKEAFRRLLATYNIPTRPTQNKIQRFFSVKWAQGE